MHAQVLKQTHLKLINTFIFPEIKAVRKLHTYYAKSSKPFPSLAEMGYTPDMKKLVNAIRKDLAHLKFPDAPEHLLTWNPPLQFSQFDVAMTQASLFIVPSMFFECLNIDV